MPAQEAKSKNQDQVQTVRPEPLKTLLEWEAPAWHFKKRDREYFSTLGAIALLVIIILFFLQEWFLIVVIIALFFTNYIIHTTSPQQVNHKITNRGIITANRRYQWDQLTRFWFKEKDKQKALYVETLFGIPRQLHLLLGEIKEEQVKKILASYLLEEEPEKTWTDNATEWLSRRVPLEKSS